MCRGCWEKYGSPTIVNDAVRAAARAIEVYENIGFSGLHIVVDDWNIEDDDLAWCEGQNLSYIEKRCLAVLQACSLSERASAMALNDGYIDDRGVPIELPAAFDLQWTTDVLTPRTP